MGPVVRSVLLTVLAVGIASCFGVFDRRGSDSHADGAGAGQTAGAGAAGSSALPPSSEPQGWDCYEGRDECDCSTAFSGDDRCELPWECCLHTGDECVCTMSEACEAEAASRPGASIVAACPPGSEAVPLACAVAGQNCTHEY